MRKTSLKQNVWDTVKIFPMAQRHLGGPGGPQLPPVNDDWQIQGQEKDGLRISNTATNHGMLIRFDQIREFTGDAVRGEGYGMLTLKVQVHIGGCHMWTTPIAPWGPTPDPFANVHDWRREYDGAYIQSLFPIDQPAPVMPQVAGGNPGLLGPALLALFVCVGIAIANA